MTYKAKDLAKAMGISQSTVSLVLNNRPGISDTLRYQVLDKAREMGILDDRNTSPSDMTMRKIAFLVLKHSGDMVLHSPFYTLLLDGVTNRANEEGFLSIICQLDMNLSLKDQIDRILDNKIDGFVLWATEAVREDLPIMQSLQVPFVVIDNNLFCDSADTISINNQMGIRNAFEHLYSLGHRNIGYLSSKSNINSFDERRGVYEKCMRERGLEIHEKSVIPVSYREYCPEDFLPFLTSRESLPTAFLSDNDMVSISAVHAFTASGLRVPDDVSIVGFDNRSIGELYPPKLTTVAMPNDFFGRMAVDILLHRIQTPSYDALPPVHVLIGNRLVVRNSTAALKLE